MKNRATKYLQEKHPSSLVLSQDLPLVNPVTKETDKVVFGLLAVDPELSVKHRMIAVPSLGSIGEVSSLAQNVTPIFDAISGVQIAIGNSITPTGSTVDSITMPFSGKIRLYTDGLKVPIQLVIAEFESFGHQIEVVDESNMYKSIFISYGGPDEDSVSMLNKKLKTVGVTTWFFPNDSIPGQKLHRMMHEGVNKHDKVLLVCSKCSLTRAGVLNEIERVLEREAKEGGSDILIPVTLDQYIFDGWKPDRTDIADQLKSRVIINVDPTDDNYDLSIEKLVKALKS
ncbi:TPA: TIR domain-containing protein [Vibrio vulnificus]|uniref:TIR domain-containing protein n=1 Tax=Vibrio vulnificus TaxID=672 RepID=UPI001A1E4D6F|nr:toll/interleukin-1 receptor domain-containing protein [Vibrio vulnificus]HAS8174013.1 TIR domain-containing protein [Vibrio vulnificus]HAS8448119.1 TIR domain-containing protein [Vibrio vulnificus]HAS8457094.1 TIR domain-containing protein [Vibrio vulnificus]HAS8561109.1 TIR domain-containing protein [Vibrio vulnificus]